MNGSSDYQTANYPSNGDSTASGGYGAAPERAWSTQAQRGSDVSTPTLIDQSPTGGPISKEIHDAVQGKDASAREQFAHEKKRDFGAETGHAGLNPYGRSPDTRKEAEEMLASKFSGREYEGGTSTDGA
ncbi:hypothetical protein BDY19DRAFT_938953 [Irpex rosettiformis]|uniref:Uncharacterized protein n=1 Tax=Irpex rosettiformis TaxID=378272 RepID=A0ACB8U7B9_9APHY|nr:hypothetical protein BDY19DRAFT_938953 [Irpex rosettiformis]